MSPRTREASDPTAGGPKVNLLGLELSEIEVLIRDLSGVKAYSARQVYAWIYAKRQFDFAHMSNLALPLRNALRARFEIVAPEVERVSRSADGTRKYLFRLRDGELIESVLIPEPSRNTMCLSTQVGCRMGCRFCATALMGLRRHLSSGEIVGQALHILDEIGYRDRRVNVVFMGMGEGLDNYDQAMRAFRLLSDPTAMAVAPRRITISTVGYVPGIERLSREPRAPKLAISLNSPFDHERSEIMPINRKWPIQRLIEAAKQFMNARHDGEQVRLNERVTFEYILLKGVNDTPAHARELTRIIRQVPAKLNLIAYNPTPSLPFDRPEEDWIRRFQGMLLHANVPVSYRRSRGQDIEAACGQLVTATRTTAHAERA